MSRNDVAESRGSTGVRSAAAALIGGTVLLATPLIAAIDRPPVLGPGHWLVLLYGAALALYGAATLAWFDARAQEPERRSGERESC